MTDESIRVAVVGLWHLGAVTAACTAAAGFTTIAIDADASVIAKLQQGSAPLFEPGLDELVGQVVSDGVLSLTTDPAAVINADVVWICHDTPVDDNDEADVESVLTATTELFEHLSNGAVVLVSAQMPVGSVAELERRFSAVAGDRTVSFACSPENLRLGTAIDAFNNAERIVVGTRDDRCRRILEPLLGRFCNSLLWTSVESAEMTKHAINAFLAISVTFANELATLCERVDADAFEVEMGLKSEPRIGPKAYLRPGPAFAGGTLARDINFLTSTAAALGVDVPVIRGVLPSNEVHRGWTLRQLTERLGSLAGHTIGVLGLAYKPGTSALRRSSAVELCRSLLEHGATVQAFDPSADALPPEFSSVTRKPNAIDVADDASAVVLATEWPEFQRLDPEQFVCRMSGRLILDPARVLGPTFENHDALDVVVIGRTR